MAPKNQRIQLGRTVIREVLEAIERHSGQLADQVSQNKFLDSLIQEKQLRRNAGETELDHNVTTLRSAMSRIMSAHSDGKAHGINDMFKLGQRALTKKYLKTLGISVTDQEDLEEEDPIVESAGGERDVFMKRSAASKVVSYVDTDEDETGEMADEVFAPEEEQTTRGRKRKAASETGEKMDDEFTPEEEQATLGRKRKAATDSMPRKKLKTTPDINGAGNAPEEERSKRHPGTSAKPDVAQRTHKRGMDEAFLMVPPEESEEPAGKKARLSPTEPQPNSNPAQSADSHNTSQVHLTKETDQAAQGDEQQQAQPTNGTMPAATQAPLASVQEHGNDAAARPSTYPAPKQLPQQLPRWKRARVPPEARTWEARNKIIDSLPDGATTQSWLDVGHHDLFDLPKILPEEGPERYQSVDRGTTGDFIEKHMGNAEREFRAAALKLLDDLNSHPYAPAAFVDDPSPELESIYKTFFGMERWRNYLAHLDMCDETIVLRQIWVLVGIMSAYVFEEGLKKDTPWDIKTEMMRAFGEHGTMVEELLLDYGHTFTGFFRHLNDRQLRGKKHLEDHVKPHARILAGRLARILTPHLKLMEHRTVDEEWDEEISPIPWMEHLEKAIASMLIVNQSLHYHKMGPFELEWPAAGSVFDRDQHLRDYDNPAWNHVLFTAMPGITRVHEEEDGGTKRESWCMPYVHATAYKDKVRPYFLLPEHTVTAEEVKRLYG